MEKGWGITELNMFDLKSDSFLYSFYKDNNTFSYGYVLCMKNATNQPSSINICSLMIKLPRWLGQEFIIITSSIKYFKTYYTYTCIR